MGKQKGIINIRGRVGDTVFTDGKHGRRVRTTPELSEAKRKEKAALPQLKKTHASNGIASAINNAVKHYAGALKPGNFYQTLHKKFSNEISAERTLKLTRIWGLEVNEKYSFGKALLSVNAEVKIEKKAYIVEAEVAMPPGNYRDNNSFSLEFILLVFTKGTDECRHSAQYSSWMYIGERKTKYLTFSFDRKPGDTDYLLACRAVFAHNANEEDVYWSSAVMRFVAGGALTKKGMKLIADAQAAGKVKKGEQMPIKKVVRVEARDEK